GQDALTERRATPGRQGAASNRSPDRIPSKEETSGGAKLPTRLGKRSGPGLAGKGAGRFQAAPNGFFDMRIKRFTAPDMRTAVRMVREGQGGDAGILCTRTGAGGVGSEVVAATGSGEALVAQALRAGAPGIGDASAPAPAAMTAARAEAAAAPA